MSTDQDTVRSTCIGALAVLFWGFTIPLSKYLGGFIGQFTIGGIVFICAGVFGFATFGKPVRIEGGYRFLYLRFLLYVSYLVLLYTALDNTQPEALTLIILSNYIWPLATVLFSLLLQKMKPNFLKLSFGILLAGIGIIIEFGGSNLLHLPHPPLYCSIFAIVGALCWGYYSALNKVRGAEWGGPTWLPVICFGCGICMLSLGFLRGEVHHFENASKVGLILYTFLPFLGGICWDHGTRHGNIVLLGFVADLTPWVSLCASYLLFGTAIHPHIMLAALCILSGAWVCRKL